MWWIIGIVVGSGIGLFVGALVYHGGSTRDDDDNYMIDDRDPDAGDRS